MKVGDRKLIRNKVTYEWVWEYSDSHGDIYDLEHGDTLVNLGQSRLQHYEGEFNDHGDPIVHAELALIRFVGNDVDGLIEKDYAYVEKNKLPEFIDDYKIPQKFHKELKAFVQTVGLGDLGEQA